MTFISYAANFEDVLLWRALRDAPPGNYLDVGAGDPRAASATHALYERGWHGINLEPAPGLLRRLRIERPADINLGIGAAPQAGEAAFHEVPESGDSTFDATRAEALVAAGQTVVLRRVPVETLDAILAAHPLPALHLLKIGTGADAAGVLQGFDLRRWQPWIVLADAQAGVGPALEAAGYSVAHVNGHSVFYTAPGRGDLRAALALPPHPADDFVLAEGHHYGWPLDEWRNRTATAEADAEEARTWAQAHVREWREKHAHLTEQEELAREMTQRATVAEALVQPLTVRAESAEWEAKALATELARVNAEVQRISSELGAANGELVVIRPALAVASSELSGVVTSLSWRLTRPLREANLLRVRIQRRARRVLGPAQHHAAVGVKAVLRRAIHFVLARPKLAFFVRRQVARNPRLVQLARRVLLRSHEASSTAAAAAQTAPPPAVAAVAGELPDAALRVLRDLHRVQR